MKQLVDTVSAIRLDHAAFLRFGVCFDHVANIAEEHAGLYDLDGFVQTLASGFSNADGVGVCS